MSSDDRVLVACPTYRGLSDILPEYLEAYDALVFPNRRLMLVDNTDDGGEYAASIREAVGRVGGMVKHVEPSRDWEDTFHRCWEVIATQADWNGYQWVLSLEQDVIVPPLALDTLLNVAAYIRAPFVTHTYPFHGGKRGLYEGLGCTLMTTELLNGALGVVYERVPLVEGAIYEVAKRGSHASLTGLLDIRHRDAADKFWQFDDILDPAAVGIE